MTRSRNNTLAGLFVIAGILAALVVVILLGGGLERLGTRDYTVRFSLEDGVAGIVPGAKVLVGGREAGTVKRLRFIPEGANPEAVIVTVSIRRNLGITFREGAVVQLNAPLLGGTGTLNFPVLGSGRELSPTDEIRGKPAPPALLAAAGYGPEQADQLRNVFRRADEISERFVTLSDDAGAVVSSVRERSGPWLDRFDSITKNVDDAAARAPKIAEDLQARLDQVREFIDTGRAVLEENRPDVRETISNARSVSEKADAFMDRLNGELVDLAKDFIGEANAALDRARTAIDRVDGVVVENVPMIRRTAANFRLASDQLAATLAEVRRSPWRLLYRPDKRELEFELLYDAAALYAGAISDLRSAAETVEVLTQPNTTPPADRERVQQAFTEMNAALERYRAVEREFLRLISERAEKR